MAQKQFRHVLQLLLLGALAAGLAGCEAPLFPKQAERTPYDRYLRLRGQERAQSVETGPLGTERPALRERLKPLGNP